MSEWEWFGHAGHFCLASKCQFHLCTLVGKYLVSTVGAYYDGSDKLQDIGYNRKYETMVFKAGRRCKAPGCMCGLPTINGQELDFSGYNTPREANKGHLTMCHKWATK